MKKISAIILTALAAVSVSAQQEETEVIDDFARQFELLIYKQEMTAPPEFWSWVSSVGAYTYAWYVLQDYYAAQTPEKKLELWDELQNLFKQNN